MAKVHCWIMSRVATAHWTCLGGWKQWLVRELRLKTFHVHFQTFLWPSLTNILNWTHKWNNFMLCSSWGLCISTYSISNNSKKKKNNKNTNNKQMDDTHWRSWFNRKCVPTRGVSTKSGSFPVSLREEGYFSPLVLVKSGNRHLGCVRIYIKRLSNIINYLYLPTNQLAKYLWAIQPPMILVRYSNLQWWHQPEIKLNKTTICVSFVVRWGHSKSF